MNGFVFLANRRYLKSQVMDKQYTNEFKPEIKDDSICNDLAQTLHKLKKLKEEDLFSHVEVENTQCWNTLKITFLYKISIIFTLLWIEEKCETPKRVGTKIKLEVEQLSEDDETDLNTNNSPMKNKLCRLHFEPDLKTPDHGVYRQVWVKNKGLFHSFI